MGTVIGELCLISLNITLVAQFMTSWNCFDCIIFSQSKRQFSRVSYSTKSTSINPRVKPLKSWSSTDLHGSALVPITRKRISPYPVTCTPGNPCRTRSASCESPGEKLCLFESVCPRARTCRRGAKGSDGGIVEALRGHQLGQRRGSFLIRKRTVSLSVWCSGKDDRSEGGPRYQRTA